MGAAARKAPSIAGVPQPEYHLGLRKHTRVLRHGIPRLRRSVDIGKFCYGRPLLFAVDLLESFAVQEVKSLGVEVVRPSGML